MTNEQLIATYNPANAPNLKPEDLTAMRTLTDDQIDVLAKAYPNQPTRRSYLRLYDEKLADNKQLYQLSTWQNLNNVRKFANLKNLRPFDFLLAGNRFQTAKAPGQAPGKQPAKKVVVDLTAQQAAEELKASLGGDKKAATAKVTADKKATKAAPKANLKAVPAPQQQVETSVDKSATPADQQFTGGE